MSNPRKTRQRLTAEDKNFSPLYNRHIAAYDFCLSYAKGRKVLEIGCSDGYGSYLIAKVAKKMLATDIDKDAVFQAKKKYRLKNLNFATVDALDTKLKDKFDLIISFQVIEHISDVDLYLENVKKSLANNGIFIFSTPNRKLRLDDGQKPWNKFHYHEYDSKELNTMLRNKFSKVSILGLTASQDIYNSEVGRLNLRRKIAKLDPINLYSNTPRWMTDGTLKILGAILKKGKHKSSTSSKEDYWITKEKIDRCLDIFVICKN